MLAWDLLPKGDRGWAGLGTLKDSCFLNSRSTETRQHNTPGSIWVVVKIHHRHPPSCTFSYAASSNTLPSLSLFRMKDTSRKNNMFAQFRKNERDKQKLIDTVAKQLRGLISSHHS